MISDNAVYIVAYGRSAVGKAGPKGSLGRSNPVEVGATVLNATLDKLPELDRSTIDDVIIGCAFPEAEQGMNLGRVLAQTAGLPDVVPGQTVNRFCASGLQSIAMGSAAIKAGYAETIVAGGVEFMSTIKMGGERLAPVPRLMAETPDAYVTMGITAENVAAKYDLTREQLDAFSVRSHQRAAAATQAGVFRSQIVPVTLPDGSVFDTDEGIRPDSNLATLAKLRPAFKVTGMVTAGNSSQTSDGVGMTVVMSGRRVKELGVTPIARFVSFAVTGLDPAYMGEGPITAIPRALERAGMSVDDVDVIELNEAFASQALASIQVLGLDEEKTNINGGAIAMGHPLGATGAILTAKALAALDQTEGSVGVVSMCIGGGMGAAAVLERFEG